MIVDPEDSSHGYRRMDVAGPQSATVTPTGATTGVDDVVSAIGMLPVDTSGTSPTYPATVLVPQAGLALSPGSRADVAVEVAAATGAVTVSASATTPLATTGGATTAMVQVLSTGGSRRPG